MEITIRRAAADDAESVMELINSIIEEGGLTSIYPALTTEQEEAFIERLGRRSTMFVAESKGAVLGVQTIEPFSPYTHSMDHVAVMGTYIYRGFRRQGIGRKLFQLTLGFARKRGYEKIIVYIRAGNPVAQAFYREMGLVPKMMLERQVKIGNQYDDEVMMEMFITPAEDTARVKSVAEATAAPTEVAEPTAFISPAPAVDPIVGAVTVRRARRRDIRTLAAIMKGTMRWRPPPTEEAVLEMLFDKGYWLAMSRKGGGLSGWQAENLVMCIDDFYVYPPTYYPQVGGPLLETIETESKALSCEVAIAFLDERIAPEAIQFLESHGYKRQKGEELYPVWREVAQDFLTENRFMMVKRLRERRIMRPL